MTMEQRRLGSTGVWVSELCPGTMMFGEWGTKDHDESIRIIHRALDAGITFVDTADVYSFGESEVIVGKALTGRRDDIVLATKAFMPMSDNLNHRGSSRRWIIREAEDSLRRLGTGWIDLYQIHRWDPETDLDETLGALSDLVHQGKIRYFGHSTFPASAIVEAQWTAQRRNRERFVTEQPTYSILTRGIENDVLPTCQRYGMGVLSYSPWPADGFLAATARTPPKDPRRSLARAWPTGSTSTCPRTSASSKQPVGSPSSPTTPAPASSSSRSPSSYATPPSPRPSSAPGPWNTSNHSSPLPASTSPTTSSTASTRSSPPASPSTPPTTAGSAPPSARPPAAADG